MKNSYKVIVKATQGAEKSTTHDVPAPGSLWGGLKIKATPGVRYQLVDNATGQGPDNIRVKRAGNDLRISFEGRDDADVVISNYYEQTEPGFGAVIGETDPDVYYAYIPESGETAALIGNLPDGASQVGMALGGDQVVASGAAVGALVAAAGFNPLLAAPLALLGAGGGGGGAAATTTAKAATDTTPPKVTAAKLAPEDDTGVSSSDGITSDNTPRLLIDADADATEAAVTLNGKTYTSTTKNAQGQFVVQVPDADALGNGVHPFTVVVKDAAGNASVPFTGSLTVLTDVQVPAELKLGSLVLDEDSGSLADDFLTNQQSLQFSGIVEGFDQAAQKLRIEIIEADGKTLTLKHVQPDAAGHWLFDNHALLLGEPRTVTPYLIKISVVDLAGNILKSTSQSFVVDLENPVIGYSTGPGSTGTNGEQTFTSISFNSSEKGAFASGPLVVPNGSSLQLSKDTFDPGGFALNFTDLAGNDAGSLTNFSQTWKFLDTSVTLVQGPSAGDFIDLTDSVGKYSFGTNQDALDVRSLYDTTPKISEITAINHFSMVGGGEDAITISMDDVLTLGVKNSFTASGHLQMRIDGDASDQVFLDNNLGSSTAQHWVSQATTSLAGSQYSVYSNATLGLDLFIQQGIQVTAVL